MDVHAMGWDERVQAEYHRQVVLLTYISSPSRDRPLYVLPGVR